MFQYLYWERLIKRYTYIKVSDEYVYDNTKIIKQKKNKIGRRVRQYEENISGIGTPLWSEVVYKDNNITLQRTGFTMTRFIESRAQKIPNVGLVFHNVRIAPLGELHMETQNQQYYMTFHQA